MSGINQDNVDKSTEDWLEKVKEAIKYRIWLFGHFHADRIARPKVEQYYKKSDTLDAIWDRWNNSNRPEWWIERGPFANV